MYLYKLPAENQFIFIKQKSLYNLYQPKDLKNLLLVPEKVYQKHEGHFGKINTKEFRHSATEMLKDHFLNIFTNEQLSSINRKLLGFFINQFKISKEQYAEALQKILAEDHSFDVQMQLAKYESIKRQYPTSFVQKLVSRFR